MNQYANEDFAWLRVQDMQREAENRRLIAGGRSSGLMRAIRQRLVARTTRRRRTAPTRPAGA
jgi:hypothetical protein